jgi:hypothetical protein
VLFIQLPLLLFLVHAILHDPEFAIVFMNNLVSLDSWQKGFIPNHTWLYFAFAGRSML